MSGFATLLLDPVTWDLCLDASANIAVATPPYAQAQDSASAIKLQPAELWYDSAQGISLIGQPLSLIRANCVSAAKTVPGVTSAAVYFTSFVDRQLQGQVQISGTNGIPSAVNF